MPGHAAGLVAVADTIREDHAGDVIAAGEHRGKIAASSPPDGTAMTSLCNPARSRERCALSLPAHSSMQPKGRIVVFVQSNWSGSTFLNFITILMLAGLSLVPTLSVNRELASCDGTRESTRQDAGRKLRAASKYRTFPCTCRMMLACGYCLLKTMHASPDSWPRACANKLTLSMFPAAATMRFIRRRSILTTW